MLHSIFVRDASQTEQTRSSASIQRQRVGGRRPPLQWERFKSFTYEELTKRDTVNLDIFWLKDESLEDSAFKTEKYEMLRC